MLKYVKTKICIIFYITVYSKFGEAFKFGFPLFQGIHNINLFEYKFLVYLIIFAEICMTNVNDEYVFNILLPLLNL